MIELVTGYLQNTKLGDFSERYLPSDFEGNPAEALDLAIPKLEKAVDPLSEGLFQRNGKMEFWPLCAH